MAFRGGRSAQIFHGNRPNSAPLRMLWLAPWPWPAAVKRPKKLSLHVRTSPMEQGVLDSIPNMLRTTVEALAGVLGGCDSSNVGAFDEVLRQPDDFSQRIARNSQLILQKECELGRVTDARAAHGMFEMITANSPTAHGRSFKKSKKLGAWRRHAGGFPARSGGGHGALGESKRPGRPRFHRPAPTNMSIKKTAAGTSGAGYDRSATPHPARRFSSTVAGGTRRTNFVLRKLSRAIDSGSANLVDILRGSPAAGRLSGKLPARFASTTVLVRASNRSKLPARPPFWKVQTRPIMKTFPDFTTVPFEAIGGRRHS